jgi:hypothetical protein
MVMKLRNWSEGALMRSYDSDEKRHMTTTYPPLEVAPADYVDPVIEAYKKDVDRTLLRENLKLTVEQRLRKAESVDRSLEQMGEGPPDYADAVIEAYKKDVDRTLLRENLKLTVQQRVSKADSFHRSIEKWREAGKRAREAVPEARS